MLALTGFGDDVVGKKVTKNRGFIGHRHKTMGEEKRRKKKGKKEGRRPEGREVEEGATGEGVGKKVGGGWGAESSVLFG